MKEPGVVVLDWDAVTIVACYGDGRHLVIDIRSERVLEQSVCSGRPESCLGVARRLALVCRTWYARVLKGSAN